MFYLIWRKQTNFLKRAFCTNWSQQPSQSALSWSTAELNNLFIYPFIIRTIIRMSISIFTWRNKDGEIDPRGQRFRGREKESNWFNKRRKIKGFDVKIIRNGNISLIWRYHDLHNKWNVISWFFLFKSFDAKVQQIVWSVNCNKTNGFSELLK